MNGLWSLATVVGPILLIAAIIVFTLRNRAAGRRSVEQAEQGARDLREELERDPEYREQ